MTTTTFTTAFDIVYTPARSPELIRSEARNEFIDTAKIANRSNYTRVSFKNDSEEAFLIPARMGSVRILTMPAYHAASFNFFNADGKYAGAVLNTNEMRAMAYGLLAAANAIDGRDTTSRASKRKPATVKA